MLISVCSTQLICLRSWLSQYPALVHAGEPAHDRLSELPSMYISEYKTNHSTVLTHA